MRIGRRTLFLTLAAVLGAVVPSAAQPAPGAAGSSGGPDVQIVSPDADAYLSGITRLRAAVDPIEAAAGAAFFIDGRQVCEVPAAPFECDWDAGPNVRAHQIRLVVNLAAGGRVFRTVRTKGLAFADVVDVDAVQVTVTVTDQESGQYVSGLPRSAFRVFEDGRRQTISNFASEDVPLELIVAVDISGSMTGAMAKLKRAVKDFLSAVPEHNEVTLLGFNDTVIPLARKTTNLGDRVRAVDRLAPWGATALYDVIVRGVDMLGRQAGRRAMVVFSDGEDQGSHVTLDDVERRLQASDVTLYMIGQGRGITHDYLKKVMNRLVEPTGGRVFATDNIDRLQDAFGELLDELSNQYLLGYQPTNLKRDDTWREIRVEVEGHKGVRARQGYRAVQPK
jgi:Ca-activated chloride channel homolog